MSKLSINTDRGEVNVAGQRIPLAGAHAEVRTSGAIRTRFTLARFLLMGPFALAFPKKIDERHLYLTVTGLGASRTVELPPTEELATQAFAAQVNAASGVRA